MKLSLVRTYEGLLIWDYTFIQLAFWFGTFERNTFLRLPILGLLAWDFEPDRTSNFAFVVSVQFIWEQSRVPNFLSDI